MTCRYRGIRPLRLTYLSLALASGLVAGALVSPGLAGAGDLDPDDVSIRRGTVVIEEKSPIKGHEVPEIGPKLGKVPRCTGIQKLIRKRNIRKVIRGLICLERRYDAANELVAGFLGGASDGDGAGACTLLAPDELARRGGADCATNVDAASLAARRPEVYLGEVGFGRHPEAEYAVLLHKPREYALLQLDIVKRHWRLSYTRQLFQAPS